MATANSRDVRLGFAIETTNEESLARLAADVRALARSGGEAAPEYARLSNELERLAKQASSLESLRQVGKDLAASNAEVQQAVQRATELAAAYARQGEAIDAAKVRQASLRGELQGVSRSLADEREQQDLLNLALKTGKTTQENAAAAAAQHAERIIVLTAEQRRLKTEVAAAGQDVAAASQGFAKLGTAAENASTQAIRLQSALRGQTQQYQETSLAAAAAGVNTAELGAAEEALGVSVKAVQQALTSTAERTARLTQEREQAAAISKELAALDQQNTAALERHQAALIEINDAFERERVEASAAAAAAERKAQAEFDAAEAGTVAADAARRHTAAVQSELAAIRESEQFIQRYEQALREAAAADEALGASEGAAAMRALEAAAKGAEAEARDLAQSLKATEAASLEFAAAQERAAGALAGDVQAMGQLEAAAARLIESERLLTVAQREEAAARDQGRAAALASAQAILQTASAAREAQATIARTAIEARQAGIALEKAFGAVGIRSIAAIEAEIDDVNAALARLETGLRAGTVDAREFDRATGAAAVTLNRLQSEALQIQRVPGVFEQLNTSLMRVASQFGAVTAAAATLGFVVRPVVESFIALQQATRVLTQVAGGAQQAQAQIEFLRQTSARSGQSFDDLAKSYSKFAASALQTGLSVQTTQQVFASVAVAAGNLGLTSDQAARALEALSQIASKGVAGMEELRQQLGDALPGVLPLLAKELGLTTAELNKVVESGQLLASEAIPAIGRALQKFGVEGGAQVQGLVAEWERLKNIVFEATNVLASGAFGQALGASLEWLSNRTKELAFGISLIGESFTVVGRQIGTVVAAIVTRDFSNLGASLDQIERDSATKLSNLASRFTEAGEGAAGMAVAVQRAAEQAGAGFSRLFIDQQKLIQQAELRTSVADKLAQAADLEYETTTKITVALEEGLAASLLASTAAADLLKVKESLVAAARNEEATLRAARQAVLDKAAADGVEYEKVQKVIEAYDTKIAKATADVEKTEALARKARELAEATELATAKFGDQSTKLEEYRKGVEGAQRAYDSMVDRFNRGKATTDEVALATKELAKAKNLLRDAVDDLSKKLELELKLLRSEAEVKKAGLEVELAVAKNRLAEAQRLGNETAARQESVRILQLEQSVRRLGTQTKLQEAQATLDLLDAEERSLRSSGQLTAEKENEIRVRRNAALAQTLEYQASVEAEKAKTREIDQVKRGDDQWGSYTGSVKGATDATRANTGANVENTKSLGGVADATGKAATARERYNALLLADPTRLVGGASGLGGINSTGNASGSLLGGTVGGPGGTSPRNTSNFEGSGWIDKSGNDLTPTDNSGMFVAWDKFERGALTQEDLPLVTAVLANAKQNAILSSYGGVTSLGGAAAGSMWAVRAQRMMDYLQAQKNAITITSNDPNDAVRAELDRVNSIRAANGAPSLGGSAPTTPTATGGVPITINLGGKSATVTASSQSEADRLIELLKDAALLSGGG